MASPHITADVIVANDFPQLSQRYDVTAVPKTVMNETVSFVGALPETEFVARLHEAVA